MAAPASDDSRLSRLPGRRRVVVAFSGGPDSMCLLHRLARAGLERPIHAVHVDHRLDRHSAERARHAAKLAATIGIECQVLDLDTVRGPGPEAAARQARYAALASVLAAGETLVTAHHADDQAETVLMRLIRGAGPEGLAGIPRQRRFGPGWLARPLLDWTRADIERWLERHRLECIRDPANELPGFDRNFIRHEILPVLRRRWPGVDPALRHSARLCAGAADSIRRRVAADLEHATGDDGSLALAALDDDGAWYRGEVIRHWCFRRGIEAPPGRQLAAFVDQLATARPDRTPSLRWSGQVLRAWRSRLWLERDSKASGTWRMAWDGERPLELPRGLGELRLHGAGRPPGDLEVRSGGRGETLRLAGEDFSRRTKRLLAHAGVPPWQRDRWPRLWYRGQLVALGDRWLEADFSTLLAERGLRLEWSAGLESGP